MKFKIGDRVRITSKECEGLYHHFDIGDEVEIIEISDGGSYWCKRVNKGKSSLTQYVHPSCVEFIKGRKFEVGARVVGVGEFEGRNIDGCKGTIKDDDGDGRWGVEFDDDIKGHNLGVGIECKRGHGWYCEESHLKLL